MQRVDLDELRHGRRLVHPDAERAEHDPDRPRAEQHDRGHLGRAPGRQRAAAGHPHGVRQQRRLVHADARREHLGAVRPRHELDAGGHPDRAPGHREVQTVSLSNYTVTDLFTMTYNGNEPRADRPRAEQHPAGHPERAPGGQRGPGRHAHGLQPRDRELPAPVHRRRERLPGDRRRRSRVHATNVDAALNAITGFAGGAARRTSRTAASPSRSRAPRRTRTRAVQVVKCNGCPTLRSRTARARAAARRWPVGRLGTVAVGTVTDGGYTLTFSGAHQGTNSRPSRLRAARAASPAQSPRRRRVARESCRPAPRPHRHSERRRIHGHVLRGGREHGRRPALHHEPR